MKTLFFRLFISKRAKRVRHGFIFFLLQFLFFISLVFLAEVFVIVLGIHDVYLPFSADMHDFIQKFVF